MKPAGSVQIQTEHLEITFFGNWWLHFGTTLPFAYLKKCSRISKQQQQNWDTNQEDMFSSLSNNTPCWEIQGCDLNASLYHHLSTLSKTSLCTVLLLTRNNGTNRLSVDENLNRSFRVPSSETEHTEGCRTSYKSHPHAPFRSKMTNQHALLKQLQDPSGSLAWTASERAQ